MNKVPPFYGNFDGSHCYQCCIRGILEHFNPEKTWTWQALDELTGKKPGLYTWLFKTCAELPLLGYDIVVISDLNIENFANNPIHEIESFYSAEGAKVQIENSDIASEQAYARAMLENMHHIKIYQRSFTQEDLKSLLQQGYLLMPQVNPYKLRDEVGYAGHAVLIYDAEGNEALYHDNGNSDSATHQANVRKPLQKFVEAARDNGKMEGLIAIRPKALA